MTTKYDKPWVAVTGTTVVKENMRYFTIRNPTSGEERVIPWPKHKRKKRILRYINWLLIERGFFAYSEEKK